jgi:hypothetical protein
VRSAQALSTRNTMPYLAYKCEIKHNPLGETGNLDGRQQGGNKTVSGSGAGLPGL